MRKSALPWLACLLVALIVVPTWASAAAPQPAPAPAAAPAAKVTFPASAYADAAFVAHDYYFQDAAGDVDDNEVTIAAGERVTFTAPSGVSPHNAVFVGAQPTSCTQTSGNPMDGNTTAPLPDYPIGGPWDGSCTFNAPGTYSFYCAAHDWMTGTVEVTGTATPTPTPTTTPTATPTTTPTATPTATATPPSRPGIRAIDTSGSVLWLKRMENHDSPENGVVPVRT